MSLLTDILFNLFCNQKNNVSNENEILKNAPTAENIDITIDFNYWKLLLFLFPNSFKDNNEAWDFYEHFCEKAKSLGEKEEVYKLPKLIWLNYKVDMISGLVTTWNSNTKSPETHFSFYLLPYRFIKNAVLKKEIYQLYENNYEHLNKLGIMNKSSNIDFIFTHFVINNEGLFKNTHWCYDDFCNDNYLWEKETKNFNLPTYSIIDFLRKIKTNQHILSDEQILEYVKNIEKKYSEFNCKIDIKNYVAELNNGIFNIYIKTKYYYPADDLIPPYENPKLPYKILDID